ncbi:phytanoyl-CoA dioxygenase family protein [Aegicerativicinus sediminis]|uniref:phytanoyl-CoA dioxygenase family protein n=1 Tax=Aegicerativicinus sediminis TaxID=2893202 RepID=UPI001E509AEA|nr:phytanoyl-CoA dioxygenase family protein [Aegicerativicinus sediminis]
MKENCKIFIDGEEFSFEVEGKFFIGDDEILYSTTDCLINHLPWSGLGYDNIEILDKVEFGDLKEEINRLLIDIIGKAIPETDLTSFSLEEYHRFVSTDHHHQKVIERTRNLEISDFNFNINDLCDKIGEHLHLKLSSFIPELNKTHVQLRISRPNSLDINPPHRDGYLSYWRDILNLWVPIAGCNKLSSLPVLPGSHLLSEKYIVRTSAKSAKINGNTYYVPCILKTTDGPFKLYRPNPLYGEALIFTPFLIHGAAVNLNPNTTRISLELRLRING